MSGATKAQITAASPQRSSWVSANAGSGKTKVLIDRVARLLLDGSPPQRILCLTYTRAAAAEMQTRLFATLGGWAMRGDDDLREDLRALGVPEAELDPDRLAAARRLFARALETPGGLKIQTIHAFCEALLRRFPIEAGVAPQFAVLEERAEMAMRGQLLDALARREPDLMRSVGVHLSGDDPDPLLREISHHRSAFEEPYDPIRLAQAFGVTPDLDHDAILAETLLPEDCALLSDLLPVFEGGAKTERDAAGRLAGALSGLAETRLAELEAVCLTGATAGQPFTAKIGKLPTKATRTAHPELTDRFEGLMRRVEIARARRAGLEGFRRADVLNRFARTWLTDLDRRKAALGVLDFDDMIHRARSLLSDPTAAGWVLWKLDGGIDHVLVDEAQDTSPAQWEVVRALTDEFFAGVGARQVERTIFVVGDEKQSIYSFQGADPDAFGAMHGHYEQKFADMGAALAPCALIHSFRSAPPILGLVDAVFGGPAGTGFSAPVEHLPHLPDRPGRVEVWPFLPKPESPEEPPWYAPVDARAPDDPQEQLATEIAERIRGWIDARHPLPGTDPLRCVRPGDVMILVQRRGPLFHAIIRALKRSGVPVAGADVLRIGGELAVRDLMALLRTAATPGDDLSLAALLRSPLGGLDEEALFDLAHGRSGTLAAALAELPRDQHQGVRAMLDDVASHADFLRPFEILNRVLVRHDGRRLLTARLGAEAEDGIDSLLDLALDYERTEPPTLEGFLAWFERSDQQVKRRVEEGSNQVRVMTVHGAKGLQAPVVIVPDTAERRAGGTAPQILRLPEGHAAWHMPKDRAPAVLAEAEAERAARAAAENMRLLYVALTRAATWLVVCGAGAEPKSGGHAWHGLVRTAAEGCATDRVSATSWPGETLLIEQKWTAEPVAASGRPATSMEASSTDDRVPAPVPDLALPPIAASALGGTHVVLGEEAVAGSPGAGPDPLLLGEALHRLLELLPEAAPEAWEDVAGRALAELEATQRSVLLADARAVLAEPGLGVVFGPGSRAEVDVSGPLDALGGRRLVGRIDRLVVAPERVLAVDFKSNCVIPTAATDVPDGILRQQGAYAAALAQIWTDRPVETAILWTREARLMELPSDIVASALRAAAAELDRQGGTT